MKKLLLPLLLILSISFLAAYESDPSAVVGYVKYDLVVGNNLVALPMTCPWTYASELGDTFGGDVDQVSYWDAANQAFVGAANLGFWMGDFEVATNDVLMLNNTNASTVSFYSTGNLPAPATYTLVAGNNTLMVPLNKSSLAWASELGDEMSAGSVDQVSYWDATNQAFVGAANIGFWMGDFEISIAMPLMANAGTPITWPTRGLRSAPTPSKAQN